MEFHVVDWVFVESSSVAGLGMDLSEQCRFRSSLDNRLFGTCDYSSNGYPLGYSTWWGCSIIPVQTQDLSCILQEERVEDHTIAGYDVFLESVSKPHPRWSTARRGKITILI